jgi:enterochelin esterase family protein
MDFPDSLVTDLIPFIDRTFRTRPDSTNRAVAGLSMGGAHALWAAFRHRNKFAWVESMSGGYMIIPGLGLPSSLPDSSQIPPLYRMPMAIDPAKVFTVLPELTEAATSKMKMFTLVVGENDRLLPQQRTLQTAFATKGIKSNIVEVPGYSHEWAFWRRELVKMLPKLFRPIR